MMMKESLFLLILNASIRNRESNYFSWWAPHETMDYFKILWDLMFRKSFFSPKMLKLMIHCHQAAPQTTSLKYFICYLAEVDPFLLQVFC